MRVRTVVRFVWRPLLVLLVAGALGWWIWSWQPRRSRPDEGAAPADDPVSYPSGWTPRPRPRSPAPGCEPRADTQCIQGDAWWLDGCANPHELAEECGRRLCRDGACEPEATGCGELSALGRCEGEIARVCEAGRPYAIDCGARGRRCVMTSEGPSCRERTDEDCDRPAEETRCDENALLACIEGRWRGIDCEARGGICATPRGSKHPRCLALGPVGPDECGPCGCPIPRTEERCDGRDNDEDGFVDEGTQCGPIDVLAFVVVDSDGSGSYTREDVADEIERLDEAFARDDEYGLQFHLVDVVRVAADEWLELDEREVQDVFRSPTFNPPREQLYVPIVFTDGIVMHEVPRPGVSTGPNGMCGDVRRTADPQPDGGAVILAKRRWDTTGAHEVGHFLGLCHTHEPDASVVIPIDGSIDEGGAEPCVESCRLEADAVCDTARDPGPELCATDFECGVWCETGDTPDPRNVMAYYPDCRSLFTAEQALMMRRTLDLRRQWHACRFGDGCPCDPLQPTCPEQMSCRAFAETGQRTWRCDLDGASVPGGVCRSSLDCSRNTLCLQASDGPSRCVRPCAPAAAACDCRNLSGFDVGVCVDDLNPSDAP